MTLYEIDARIMECINEDGEVIDIEAMDALQMERSEKIEGVSLWVKDLDAEAKAIREEEKKLAERRRANENKIESLEKYLVWALNGEKFSTPRVSVSYRKSQAVVIADPEKVPAAWYKAKYEIDRATIKEALKNGEIVPGAVLEERSNIQIK